MLEKIIDGMIETQIRNHVLKQEDANIYRYGYMLVYEMILNIVIAFMIGLLLKSLGIVISFLLFFISLFLIIPLHFYNFFNWRLRFRPIILINI